MNVLSNRDIDKTIVLGCGKSILSLTQDEIDHVNHCKIVIAMNKYMAFYKKMGIIPTHIYFVDNHENSRRFLEYIFDVCEKDNLNGLTFIVSKSLKSLLYFSRIKQTFLILKNSFRDLATSIRLMRAKHFFLNRRHYIHKPPHSSFQFISTTDWLHGGAWADSLQENLFHYRGSLTSVLNYCTIAAPNQDIFLLGNDFNGSEYFFEEELKNIPFDWTDWTTSTTKKENKHFSFIDYQGTKMQDYFPFILSELNKRNINLFCTNKDSLLVKECNVSYLKLKRTINSV